MVLHDAILGREEKVNEAHTFPQKSVKVSLKSHS